VLPVPRGGGPRPARSAHRSLSRHPLDVPLPDRRQVERILVRMKSRGPGWLVGLAIVAVVLALGVAFSLGRWTFPARPEPAASRAPSSTNLSRQLRPFVGSWYWHGSIVQVHSDGSGIASWRIYSWCGDDPTPPCDSTVGNDIIDGGNAVFLLTRVQGATALGRVVYASYGSKIPVGSLRLELMPKDHLSFPGLGGGPLCGPRAPLDCGA